MPLIRLTASILVLIFLYSTGIFYLLLPLVSWLMNICLLLTVSWTIGSTVARKYVLPNLPKVETKNKAIIVTGCDSGFGFLTALKLNSEGFYVFATVLKSDGDGAKKLLHKAVNKNRLQIISIDVTKDDDVLALRRQVDDLISSDKQVNQLYGVVNNAGILLNRGIEFAKAPTVEDWKRTFDVNLFGVVRMTRMFLPLLRKSGGRVVNLSSQAARDSVPAFVDYSASKAAVSKFTEGLQSEITKFGVVCIAVEPYFHKTEIINQDFMTKSILDGWNSADAEVHDSYGTKARDEMLSFTRFVSSDPLFVAPRTEDVSDTVAEALMSPEPQYFYECIQFSHWIVRKFRVDCLPWDLAVPIRNFLTDKITRHAPVYRG